MKWMGWNGARSDVAALLTREVDRARDETPSLL